MTSSRTDIDVNSIKNHIDSKADRLDILYTFDNFFNPGQFTTSAGDVLQVSELSIAAGSNIYEHTQCCDEITYFVSGSATVTSGKAVRGVSAGDIHYIKKGETHEILANLGENVRFFCIGFIPNERWSIFEEKQFFVKDNGNVKMLSELLLREFYAFDSNTRESIGRFLEQMLCDTKRMFDGENGKMVGNFLLNTRGSAIYRVLRYIDRHYISIKSVKEISTSLSYSECYISHMFREKMGMSVKEYLMKKKVLHADQLLSTTHLSVKEISEYFAFSSPHSFRRAYKQYCSNKTQE